MRQQLDGTTGFSAEVPFASTACGDASQPPAVRGAIELHWLAANRTWLWPPHVIDPFRQVSAVDPLDACFVSFCCGGVVEL